MAQFTSLLGILAVLFLAWLMSSHKGRIPWRTIIGGLALQFLLAAFVIRSPWGRWAFEQVDLGFRSLLDCVDAGTTFVFGSGYTEHFIAFKVLPTIIFFSAFMAIFYYYGIIQWIVGGMAKVMQVTLGTSGAETLSAAANVFVGQTEAPLVVKPYIGSMTTSELNAVMIGGFATMAGGVLAGLVSMGINAGHLLAASVMAAPGALLLAKIIQPEVDSPKTMGSVKLDIKDPNNNVLEAVANGTLGGLQLALNVGAMLIAFISLVAVVNLLLGWVGLQMGIKELSLQLILGYVFYPFAWLIGIENKDCLQCAQLLGMKMATNEYIAYGEMVDLKKLAPEAAGLSERSQAIMTYALCGFANFSSIGIQLGGIGGLAPERRSDLARLGLRAMLGGTLASLLTASIAALFI
jgi:CNT family concentrative nucleoside transporter